MSESLALELLTNDSFVMVNKKLMRYLEGDGTSAVLLGELIASHKYHKQLGSLTMSDSFPIPSRRYKAVLGLSPYKHDRALKTLTTKGFIRVHKLGFPATKHVVLDFNKLTSVLSIDEKAMEKENFYDNLNKMLNENVFTTSTIEPIQLACDQMQSTIVGVIILIGAHCHKRGVHIKITSSMIGRIKNWVRSRSVGRAFDFTLVTRALQNIQLQPDEKTYFNLMGYFLKEVNNCKDIHHKDQVLEYQELL